MRRQLRERYEKETAKVERLEDAEDREAMYRDLGWLGDDDVEGGGISSDRLGALLKRARVFKILDEEAEAAMKAAVAAAEEDGDEVDNEAGAGADFTVNVDDPRFKDIRCREGYPDQERPPTPGCRALPLITTCANVCCMWLRYGLSRSALTGWRSCKTITATRASWTTWLVCSSTAATRTWPRCGGTSCCLLHSGYASAR